MASQPLEIAAICCFCLLHSISQLYAANDKGLWFERSPEPIVAPPGDEVVFECSLNVQADEVRWRRDGRYLHRSHGNSTDITVLGAGNHTMRSNHLVVKVRGRKQAGDYQCVAWFGASALASVPARLSIAELLAFPGFADRHYKVTTGNTVAIYCGAPHSNPPAPLQYYKNGKKLQVSGAVEDLASTGTLVLNKANVQDSGSYHCAATNYITGQTVTSHHKITLEVVSQGPKEAPKFLETPISNYTVQAGMNITMQCSAVGNPVPEVTWHKVESILPPNRTQMVPGGLQLQYAVHEDEGEYSCTLSNGIGQPLTHTVFLYVLEPPVVVKEPKATLVVKEGGDLQLECQVRGSPEPEVSWLLNGEPIANDPSVQIGGGHLNISQVEKRHAGIMQCFATNILGSVYGLTMVQVLPKQTTSDQVVDLEEEILDGGISSSTATPVTGGKIGGRRGGGTRKGGRRGKDRKNKGNAVMIPPSRPNVTRLTDTSVMVRWSVPPNDGLPIQFFKVQYREMGGKRERNPNIRGKASRWMTNNEDIDKHIRSYAVDGLETNRTYRFRIAAVYSNNDNKLGPNSARFHLHKGPSNNKSPVPPVLNLAEAISPTAIQIHWQYSGSASVPVEGFYVYYRETSSAGDYIKATVEGEKQRSFNITHLQPDTAYDVKLQSFTVGAASDFSTILTHKTLRIPTESPPSEAEVATPSIDVGESSGSQLYLVLGTVLGGLVLLVIVFLIVYICNKHRNSNNQASQDSGERQDKFNDPSLQMESADVFGKNLLNGCLQQNGFIQGNKINITSNPLAENDEDKNQNVMEMSYLANQNNNCSTLSEPSVSGTSGNSNSGDESAQSASNTSKASDSKSWRAPGATKGSGENYV